MMRGLWHGDKNPLNTANYGKIVSGIKFEPHIKIMKITKNTSFRAAKLISNLKSCQINMRNGLK